MPERLLQGEHQDANEQHAYCMSRIPLPNLIKSTLQQMQPVDESGCGDPADGPMLADGGATFRADAR